VNGSDTPNSATPPDVDLDIVLVQHRPTNQESSKRQTIAVLHEYLVARLSHAPACCFFLFVERGEQDWESVLEQNE
jgi:hypothetical protein